uniref:Uncharacterized protein n=1 Tax=Macaca nemestrina TaxID=9545 RepID=A0A2K6AXT3_MACNE
MPATACVTAPSHAHGSDGMQLCTMFVLVWLGDQGCICATFVCDGVCLVWPWLRLYLQLSGQQQEHLGHYQDKGALGEKHSEEGLWEGLRMGRRNGNQASLLHLPRPPLVSLRFQTQELGALFTTKAAPAWTLPAPPLQPLPCFSSWHSSSWTPPVPQ